MKLRWWKIVRMRLRSLTQRTRIEQQLDSELQFHLNQQTEENLRAGMTPEEAHYAALRKLGGYAQIQEECRDMRQTNYLDNLAQDLRYTIRTLLQNPGFAAVIVLTLALSIGANSAIFSVIDGVLLRPLPYPGQDRLERVFFSSRSFPKFPMNPFDLRDFRERNRSFEGLAGYTRSDLQLSGIQQPVRLRAFSVTAGFFGVLGLRPRIGREFDIRDELPANARVAILSDRMWREHFAADPNILGSKIRLESKLFSVVGVMSPGAEHPGNAYHSVPYGETVDVWIPFQYEGNPNHRGNHFLDAIGRLKSGVTDDQARADLNAVLAQLAREHPGDVGWSVFLVPLYREITGPSQRMLLVLLSAVGLVLLIACANAANLLLARATARQREMAVRSALGAGRSRLIRQMLAESLAIALAGGALGVAIAIWGVRVLVHLLPAGFPRSGDIHVNAPVFLFTLAIAVATGLLFGLAPALQVSRAGLHQGLREGGRSATSSGRQFRLRNILVASEVSLACILLIGAGLILRSFVNLQRMDPGFRPERVLTAGLSLPDQDYTEKAVPRFYEQLIAQVSALPNVNAAGAGTYVPWTGYDENLGGWIIEGKRPAPNDENHGRYHIASPGFFTALGIPLLRGRFFSERDNLDSPRVVIVNQSLARRYWPSEDAIGKRISFFSEHPKEKDWSTVVGIVGDVKDTPESKATEPAFWWPMLQQPWPFSDLSIVIRTRSNPVLLADRLRQTVRQLDPNLAVFDVRTMDEITDLSVSTARFTLFLVGTFAGLAILLAAAGIYGVISYSVNQRTHEFGMRMALGANPGDVLRLVLAQGLKLGIAGVALGVLCALALGRLLGTLLYEVGPTDPLTFVTVPLIAVTVAVVACYLPARRATQADPMTALRVE